MNPATSANGVPVDRFPPGHTFHMHQQTQSREHWPQMLPQNQSQQFHAPPWPQSQPAHLPSAPQMHPQAYPNPSQYFQNPSSSTLDFSSIIPQQIMQDFLRLSTPVGSSPNDDTILAQALHESRQTGKTYRQALDGLHGVNNHAANLWKDYYLDHHDRFDLLVSRLAEQPKTAKKPSLPSKLLSRVKDVAEGPSTSPQVARKRHLSPPLHQIPKKKGPSSVPRQKRPTPQPITSALSRPPKRPRATFNSLSAPLPSSDVPNLMPPQADIPLPDPPSRSPTPPVVMQEGTNGNRNRYSKEDREYFLKFLVWRLKQDSSLTKKKLCELLHDKAPHHSATSWASHWHQRHTIADKILATYHGDSEDNPEVDEDQQDEEEEEVEVEVGVKNDDARSDAMSAAENSRDQRGLPHSQGTFSDFGDPNADDTAEDERDMGEHGNSFTRGDWCTLARFIAKNHWDTMSRKERWDIFTENHGTKRSAKAWAEFYRKNEAAILKLSRSYSPGSSRDNKIRRGYPPRRNRQELSLDEDGECETDNEDS